MSVETSLKEIEDSYESKPGVEGRRWRCMAFHRQFQISARVLGRRRERVVAVTIGSGKNLEMATRAKTNLIIILVEGKGSFYAEILPTCC